MSAKLAPIILHPPDTGESAFMTPKEAAFQLQVSRSEVYRLMDLHGLPNAKIAGVRRIPRAEFWAWVRTWRR